MSKIWDSLKSVEQASRRPQRDAGDSSRGRRRGKRVWVYVPVSVYGHTAGDEPFHEPTEALRVNAGGGLITLTTAVRPGNPILLFNKANHKEQKCRLVGCRGSYLGRSAVGFEFLEDVPDFWDSKAV
jgi:hypothetical protein